MYKKEIMKILTILSFLLIPLISHSTEYSDLEGNYYIGGKTIHDAPKNEPKNTHLYIKITGNAAKDMYQMIKTKPKYDICLDNGSMTKFSRSIQCTESKDKKSYSCHFSLNPNDETIGSGLIC